VATTPTRLMTVEEFDQIPNPPGGVYELYHGELVKMGFPQISHAKRQLRIALLLRDRAGDQGVVKEEMAFRALPEHECWAADVALVSKERWDNIVDWLMGAPELVVEIISPSNSRPKLMDKGRICLENGAREFWIVDLRRRTVTVLALSGETTYAAGERVPLFFDGEIAIDDIFE
jgi:Uma2 family endonuclease